MRPLRVEEIAEVVAIDAARNPAFDREEVLEDPLEVLNICSSLVTISTIKADEESDPLQQIVSLAHYSVQEYLVSDRIKQGPAKQYSTHEVECHSMITKGSLRYLIQLQQPLSKEIVYTSALARYAAEFWSSHLRKATEETKELTQAAMGLMSIDVPAYLTWIQLYDPDSPWLQPDLNKGLDSAAAPLYYAALLGLSTIVKMLLAQGAEINIQGGRYGNALHAASIKGHTQVVRILLNAGADIDAQSEDHGSILQAASCEGHEQIVKVLIDNGADINKQSSRDNSAIQSASASGHLKIAQLLLDNGADVNKQGGLYGNALNAAAAEGHIAIVQLLLKNGAEISEHDSQGKSVLHHATNNAYCSLILVEFLLSQGAPANTTDTNNMTPLHYSVKFNNKSIATLLLNSGVSIDTGVHRKPWSPNTVKTDTSCQISFPGSEPNISRISSGLTPLHFAALTGNSIMTKFLLNHGADPNALSIYSESPMHLALRETLHGPKYEDDWTNPHWRVECLFDHADFVEEDGVESIHENITRHREGVLGALLADARTSLAIGDYQNEHPLHCVKYRKSAHVCIVKELVSRGALLSERNMKQQSALHLASRAGDHDAAVFLLSVGVDPALKDNEGLNTIHHAARSGDHETIAVLLETAGATRPSLVAAKDTRGRNALHHLLSTTSQVRKETIQLLLDKGVDGLELDVSGKSPLASYFGRQHWLGINIDIFQLLLSVKGSSSYVDQNGQNLGHLCVKTRECRVQVFELLTQHGVDLTQKDFQGRTVLHCAAISGSLTEKTLHHLLHVIGLALDAQDVEGKTALQHAAEMASKDHHRHIFDYKRWYRTTKLLLESEVSHTASRTIVG
jgi:ankyrin repeat protein